MKLNPSKGRMFENVDYTMTFYQGCDIDCAYCWAGLRKIGRAPKFVAEKEKNKPLNAGSFKTPESIIFVNSAHDWLAPCIPDAWIRDLLHWVGIQPKGLTFYLQSKNIPRTRFFLPELDLVKDRIILGTTIETNRGFIKDFSKAPDPFERFGALANLSHRGYHTRLSMEPLFAFDPETIIFWITRIHPEEVMIGLDNYQVQHGLQIPQPTQGDYEKLRSAILYSSVKLVEKESIKSWYRHWVTEQTVEAKKG